MHISFNKIQNITIFILIFYNIKDKKFNIIDYLFIFKFFILFNFNNINYIFMTSSVQLQFDHWSDY